jgi:hypothetical protein
MRLSEMFPSNLLKSQDLLDAGGEITVTIEKVEMKTFDRDDGTKDTKPIVYFADNKQMVCNKTNAGIIATMHGDDTDEWIGKSITLTVKEVEFQGKTVFGIRVKNENSRDALIQEFWTKARELGYDQAGGQALLKAHDMDFKAALATLAEPQF